MAKGMDRLGSLFTTKKHKTTTTGGTVEPLFQVTAHSSGQQFPPPTFIHPKDSRIAAREEVVTFPAGRASCLPRLSSPHPVDRSITQGPTHSANSRRTQCPPRAPAFIFTEARVAPLSDDLEFSESSLYPTHRYHEPEPADGLGDQDSQRRSSNQPSARASSCETRPSPDIDDDVYRFLNNELLAPPRRKPLTLDSPRELYPEPNSEPKGARSIHFLSTAVAVYPLAKTRGQKPLGKALEQSGLVKPLLSRFSPTSPILREPTLNEFLALSDDDIAEPSIADLAILAPTV